jgi:hypothetical protein
LHCKAKTRHGWIGMNKFQRGWNHVRTEWSSKSKRSFALGFWFSHMTNEFF